MGCIALVWCVLLLRCGLAVVVWYLYAGCASSSACTRIPHHPSHTTTWHQHTSNQSNRTHEITQQISRKLLRMDVLTSETCWTLNNEIIKQVTSSWSLFIQSSVHSVWDIILCVVSIPVPNCWEGWVMYFLRFIWTASSKRCTESAVHTLRLHQTTLLKSSNTESLSSNFRTSITPNFLNEHHVHWRTVSVFLPPALHFHVTKSFFFFNRHPSLCNVAGHITVNTWIILRTFIPVVLLNQ